MSAMPEELPFHPNTDKSDLLHKCVWFNPELHLLSRALSNSLSGIQSSTISISSGEAGSQTETRDQLSHSADECHNSWPICSPRWHPRNPCGSSPSAEPTSCAASGNRRSKFLHSASRHDTEKEMSGWSESIPLVQRSVSAVNAPSKFSRTDGRYSNRIHI